MDSPDGGSVRRLDGKVAIVTGAASGIGRATAIAMARDGASVVVADIDADGAGDVATEITGAGGAALGVHVDVSDERSVAGMVARAVDAFGGLHVLHNNAAVLDPSVRSRDTDVETIDLDVWDRTMAVNLRGPMLGCRFAVPHMRACGGGSIVMTSSGAATHGDYTRCAYGTSKGGLNSLVRYVATAFGRDGIRCNAVAPGVVLTPAVRALLSPAAVEEMARHHVTRLGEPDDIAEIVCFLASDAGAFVTGEVVTADGGLGCHLPTYAEATRRRARPTK